MTGCLARQKFTHVLKIKIWMRNVNYIALEHNYYGDSPLVYLSTRRHVVLVVRGSRHKCSETFRIRLTDSL